jgi:hypothetical protein
MRITMITKMAGLFFLLTILLAGCSVGKNTYSPDRKFSLKQVEKDYSLYQSILEAHHPSLYWYTSKDSMNYYFKYGKSLLKDSMTEIGFRKILNYVTAQIGCGHTTTRASQKFTKFADNAPLTKLFPLSVKIWPQATVVTVNLNRKDSLLKRGTVIKSINGRTIDEITDTLFRYISTDGYNNTHRYQRLSSFGAFGSAYSSLFGLSDKYAIAYVAVDGTIKKDSISVYNIAADTADRKSVRPTVNPPPRPSRHDRKEAMLNRSRLLQLDTVNKTAMMNLATFTKNYGLRRFFKNSFNELRKNKINYLIIDLRSNGGGSVSNSTILSRYIADNRFKICDTLFSIRRKSPYHKYIKGYFWNHLFMNLFTARKRDGNFHFGYFERHYFKPKKANHFNGKVYVLTGGNSFSATTLFLSSVIKQDNVTVIGEETGGGAYGNSAWLIPDVTLPVTGVRFRLPLFRLVVDKDVPKNGRGVQPEIEVGPTVDDVRKGNDYKLDKAMELIKKDKSSQ